MTSRQAIERLCRRDAGYRSIVCEHVPDHTVSARFRRRHIDKPAAVFTTVLRMCRDAGLIRRGLVVLDGTKVKANASLEANRSAAMLDEQVRRMLADAQSPDQGENRPSASEGRERLPPALSRREDRPARLWACKPKPAAGSVDPERVAKPTDPDSRIMKTRRGWVQGYNVQAVVTPQQIILASEVTTEANDVRQLQPMLDQAQAMVELLLGEDAAAHCATAGHLRKPLALRL
jgi:hypothetical protein